jgi:hypothetical protein
VAVQEGVRKTTADLGIWSAFQPYRPVPTQRQRIPAGGTVAHSLWHPRIPWPAGRRYVCSIMPLFNAYAAVLRRRAVGSGWGCTS